LADQINLGDASSRRITDVEAGQLRVFEAAVSLLRAIDREFPRRGGRPAVIERMRNGVRKDLSSGLWVRPWGWGTRQRRGRPKEFWHEWVRVHTPEVELILERAGAKPGGRTYPKSLICTLIAECAKAALGQDVSPDGVAEVFRRDARRSNREKS
jgi:hypothetical protein